MERRIGNLLSIADSASVDEVVIMVQQHGTKFGIIRLCAANSIHGGLDFSADRDFAIDESLIVNLVAWLPLIILTS